MSKLERTVYDVVVSVVADYGRMQRLLSEGCISRDQAVHFTRQIGAIDHALVVVCQDEDETVRSALLDDIANRRGFECAASKSIYNTRGVFVRRKNEAIELIAKLLYLV